MSDIEIKAKQCTRILLFIQDNGSINPMQAMNRLGVMRLAARISDMEKAGLRFEHNPVKSFNRFGEKIRYMEYRLAV